MITINVVKKKQIESTSKSKYKSINNCYYRWLFKFKHPVTDKFIYGYLHRNTLYRMLQKEMYLKKIRNLKDSISIIRNYYRENMKNNNDLLSIKDTESTVIFYLLDKLWLRIGNKNNLLSTGILNLKKKILLYYTKELNYAFLKKAEYNTKNTFFERKRKKKFEYLLHRVKSKRIIFFILILIVK